MVLVFEEVFGNIDLFLRLCVFLSEDEQRMLMYTCQDLFYIVPRKLRITRDTNEDIVKIAERAYYSRMYLTLARGVDISNFGIFSHVHKLDLWESSIDDVSCLTHVKHLRLKHCQSVTSISGLSLESLTICYCNNLLSISDLKNCIIDIFSCHRLSVIYNITSCSKITINSCESLKYLTNVTNVLSLDIFKCDNIKNVKVTDVVCATLNSVDNEDILFGLYEANFIHVRCCNFSNKRKVKRRIDDLD